VARLPGPTIRTSKEQPNVKGTITKRAGARGVAYRVRVDLDPDPLTGERRRRSGTFRTRKEAESQMAQWIADGERGMAIAPSRLTVGEYLQRWLDALEGVEPPTRRRYADLVRLHIAPQLGGRLLAKLTPLDVQALYADRKAAALSPTTINLLHNVLHRALKQAVEWDLIARNVTERVKAPRPKASEPVTWDAGQAVRFLAIAERTPDAALWWVALTTGMRRSELLGLQWSDVDLQRGTLNIHQARKRGEGNRWETGAPKTRKGRRQIVLPPSAIEALRAHRTRQLEQRLALGAAYQDQNYVFAGALGQPVHPNSLQSCFERLVKAAGLPRIKLHGLRHTNATVSLASGEHPKIVQERLGHSTISMTLDRYSHVTQSMQQEAAGRLETLLQTTREQLQAPTAQAARDV
jgi:integrase